MKTLLYRLFVQNWQRKLLALVLAMIIWMVVNYQMTVTKQIHNIPVRVNHLPIGKTIENMQVNGLLNKRISLAITANRQVMDDLNPKDLEVIIDARDKPDQWIASITKNNLTSLNPSIDISQTITRVVPQELFIKQSKLVTEKIPVIISKPIGEAPKGYQFLDIWPYQLYVTVTGPEESIKRLKERGKKLIFNLSNIKKEELKTLQQNKEALQDEVSYFIPDSWKKIDLPMLSDQPFVIDDPQAKNLRIDFSPNRLIPIGSTIPVSIFFPPKYSATLNGDTYSLATNHLIVKKNGIRVISPPLYAQRVSRLFVDIVKERLQIMLIAAPKSERSTLMWSCQFIYPHELEDRYVAKVMSESIEEPGETQPHLREEYLRNRFRNYMNRFRLYCADGEKLSLQIALQANTINVSQKKEASTFSLTAENGLEKIAVE